MYADISLDQCWLIRGLGLIQHSPGYLVAMTRTKRRDGKPYDRPFPDYAGGAKNNQGIVLPAFRLPGPLLCGNLRKVL